MVLELNLDNCSMVVMGGEMQKYYKHTVPKQLSIKKGRINITLRSFTD